MPKHVKAEGNINNRPISDLIEMLLLFLSFKDTSFLKYLPSNTQT